MYHMRNVVKVRVERFELMDKLPRSRLKRLTRCEMKITGHLVYLPNIHAWLKGVASKLSRPL